MDWSNLSTDLQLNRTIIVLIAKKNICQTPKDYRPISLCNVIYKIIAKTLDERLKLHLPNYIHASQSAFILCMHISSNIILTQEITHSFSLTSWKQKGFLLKIDLAKAFDRIEWPFIVSALTRLGPSNAFIKLIEAYISTTTMSVLVNGQTNESFHPKRGLRQGCPLSPYLFVLAINELSCNLQQALQNNILRGITLGPQCPPIHSLLFADDLIIYG